MERLSKTDEEVTLEARFIDDLGADSLDVTELLMALEEEFETERLRLEQVLRLPADV